MSQVQHTHRHLQAGDLLLGDRGMCSFSHIYLLQAQKVHALFRVHQRITLGRGMCRKIKQLGSNDWLVEWSKPENKPQWMDTQFWLRLPLKIRLRQLSYKVTCPGFRTKNVQIVTTLLDPVKYSASELARLYQLRWTVEGHIRELKAVLGMGVLRTKTVKGVLKEMSVFMMVYNLIRLAMIRSAREHELDLERISFIDGLRWLQHTLDLQSVPKLLVNPLRPNRIQPRVIKRRQNTYQFMTKPRAVLLTQLLGNPANAA